MPPTQYAQIAFQAHSAQQMAQPPVFPAPLAPMPQHPDPLHALSHHQDHSPLEVPASSPPALQAPLHHPLVPPSALAALLAVFSHHWNRLTALCVQLEITHWTIQCHAARASLGSTRQQMVLRLAPTALPAPSHPCAPLNALHAPKAHTRLTAQVSASIATLAITPTLTQLRSVSRVSLVSTQPPSRPLRVSYAQLEPTP